MVQSPNEEFVKQNVEDLVEIANIDISCDLPDPEVHPQGVDSFVVDWDGVPHVINAGETRTFPRYLADHYKKHLADHILIKKELQVNDPKERPIIEAEIDRGVKESYAAPRTETQGEVIAKQVQKANPAPLPTPVAKKPAPAKKTRAELFAECKELGVETKGNETVDELTTKIQVWAGVNK